MNLYIEIENGVTKNHPAFESNLIQAFGSVPAHWEPFTRIEYVLAVYQVLESNESVYAKVNGVWVDVWSIREMTAEEKIAKQQAFKAEWAALPNRDNFSAWTFDENTCTYQPPIPRPEDGLHRWDGATNSWVLRT